MSEIIFNQLYNHAYIPLLEKNTQNELIFDFLLDMLYQLNVIQIIE